MAYKLNSVNGCTKKLEFSFDKLDLTAQIKKALVKKQSESNLKGFRKGHAPLDMIQKFYGDQVENDALNSFIQAELFSAVQTEKLRIVGYPSLENMKYDHGKSVSFDAVVEIFPEIEVKPLKGYSFKKDKVEVKKEEIEDAKKSYLGPRAEMVAIDNASTTLAKGHFAVFNFEGEKEDGSRPENMKGNEYLLEIGSGQFIPGFEDGMVGMKKGEKRDLSLSFPADYGMAELQGAKVKFHVELLEIKQKVLPDFTDELAKEFKFDSVSDFEVKTEKRLLATKERQAKEKLNQEILEKLVAENSFDVPKSMVEQQANHLKEDMKKNFAQQGLTGKFVEDYFTKWQNDLQTKAVFQVKSGLLLDALSKQYNIEATESDLEKKIDLAVEQSGLDRKQISDYYNSDKQLRANMMYGIREEKTFEKLLEQVKVE